MAHIKMAHRTALARRGAKRQTWRESASAKTEEDGKEDVDTGKRAKTNVKSRGHGERLEE